MHSFNHLGKTDITEYQYIHVGVSCLFSPCDRTEYQCKLDVFSQRLQRIFQRRRQSRSLLQHAGELSEDRAITVGAIVHLIADALS